MNMNHSIGILGAGTWGLALARLLHRNGHQVTVWSAIESEIDALNATHAHPNLPGMMIPQEIRFTKDAEETCTGKDILLFAVPSVFVRSTAARVRPYVPDGQIIVDVAKGIEPDSLMTMSEVIRDELVKDGGHANVKLVALSGPTHAEEVALDMPTSIVSACTDMQVAETVQDIFMNTCMRTYTNTDVLGVELCGAMKNIIALAAGISAGHAHHPRHGGDFPPGAGHGLRRADLQWPGWHWRSDRNRHLRTQPQQPLRQAHRRRHGPCRRGEGRGHGGRGHQCPARRHAVGSALPCGNADRCRCGSHCQRQNHRCRYGRHTHDPRQNP